MSSVPLAGDLLAGVRRRLARTPLWLRLVVTTLLLAALAIALTGGFAVRLLESHLTDQVDDRLIQFRTRTLRTLERPDEPSGAGPLRSPGERVPGVYYLVTLDAQGEIVRSLSVPLDREPPELTGLTPAEAAGYRERPFTVAAPDGERWRVIAVPRDGRTRIMAAPLGDVAGTTSRLAVIVLGVGAAVLVTLGPACHWLVRRSLRPLTEIERTAGAIAGGDLSRRVPRRHPRTEAGRLGRAVNGMLAQLEAALRAREASEAAAREAAEAARRAAAEARRSEERMRRFVADASHELRTPLTSIRGFAELYRQRRGQDPAHLLRRIEEEARRMSLLVDDLLLLARLDRRRPLDRAPVDVLGLAAGAVLDARALAPDRDVGLVRLDDSAGPVTVIGDAARLRQVIGNLVSNALQHTPAGTPFTVGVGVRDGTVLIEVADEGPGLGPEDAERVFERFYRADPARGRTGSGGTGLGLAVAAALVQAHDGVITVVSEPGRGAVFRVRLPAAPPDAPASRPTAPDAPPS